MIRRLFALGCLALVVAACAPTTTETPVLPTVAALPSATPTDVPTETPTLTLTNTATPEPSATPTKKPTSTQTRTPSITPPPSLTPTTVPSITPTVPRVTETPNSTLIAVATQTAIILEAPTLATLTPVPAGSDAIVRPTSTGTPIVAAGVIITEPQFQLQLNEALVGTSIQAARVDFVPGGINLDVTAPGASALTSGRVFISFTVFVGEQGLNNGLIIRPDSPDKFVMTDGGTPPEAFINAVYSELFTAVGGSFDTILNKRLGEDKHNLENIVIDNTTMNVLLLVPQP